jgi:hypothetical protein
MLGISTVYVKKKSQKLAKLAPESFEASMFPPRTVNVNVNEKAPVWFLRKVGQRPDVIEDD